MKTTLNRRNAIGSLATAVAGLAVPAVSKVIAQEPESEHNDIPIEFDGWAKQFTEKYGGTIGYHPNMPDRPDCFRTAWAFYSPVTHPDFGNKCRVT